MKRANVRPDWLKALVHIAALTPLAALLFDYFSNHLTHDPIREITLRTGKDALALLLLTLACSPVAGRFGFKQIMRVRRTLGLYAFTYAALHFLTFVWLDYGFDLGLIVEGIFEKPFALAGFSAFILLALLTITSTSRWKKRLGANWRRLHKMIYVAGLLALLHFFWLRWSKFNLAEPLVYGTILLVLLALRAPVGRLSKR